MKQPIVQYSTPITLVGGGPVCSKLLEKARAIAPILVGADAGADRIIAAGARPDLVIGDLDSLNPTTKQSIEKKQVLEISEQDSTDFDKALRHIHAPLILALGFTGGRSDHSLSVLSGMIKSPARCLVLSPEDVIFHAPPNFDLNMTPGDRFSLFPMTALTAQSQGLKWPLAGLAFHPMGTIGTSNQVSDNSVSLQVSGPGMICILPQNRLQAVMSCFDALPQRPFW